MTENEIALEALRFAMALLERGDISSTELFSKAHEFYAFTCRPHAYSKDSGTAILNG